MEPLFDREAARAFDQQVIGAGVPGLVLMENAGRGAADLLLERWSDRLARVVVVGGTGANGGDAWVIARRLATRGIAARALLAGDRAKVRGDAAANLVALEAVGGRVEAIGEADLGALEAALQGATAIVEGLFGTGLDREIEGWRRGLVERLNEAPAPIFAIDLPSGIDCDTGAVLGVAIEAKLTATFAAHKRGLWQLPGRRHAGEVVRLDIGVPQPGGPGGLLELSDASAWLPARPIGAHKGTAGHVLAVAGSPGKTGAALLVGHGALRAGAGLVTLAARGPARDALDMRVHELMTTALPDDGPGAREAALEAAEGKDAVVIGPGLGLDADGRALAVALARELPVPAVLDADALTAIADDGPEQLRDAAGPRVLTPHPGEASRLLGRSTHGVQADRYRAARELADRSGQIVVLKGAGTIVAQPEGRLAVCPYGTPALGVAGTGDVLSGALGASLAAARRAAEGEPSEAGAFEAACAMVVLHARAGELAARADRGLLAREVGDHLAAALQQARRAAR